MVKRKARSQNDKATVDSLLGSFTRNPKASYPFEETQPRDPDSEPVPSSENNLQPPNPTSHSANKSQDDSGASLQKSLVGRENENLKSPLSERSNANGHGSDADISSGNCASSDRKKNFSQRRRKSQQKVGLMEDCDSIALHADGAEHKIISGSTAKFTVVTNLPKAATPADDVQQKPHVNKQPASEGPFPHNNRKRKCNIGKDISMRSTKARRQNKSSDLSRDGIETFCDAPSTAPFSKAVTGDQTSSDTDIQSNSGSSSLETEQTSSRSASVSEAGKSCSDMTRTMKKKSFERVVASVCDTSVKEAPCLSKQSSASIVRRRSSRVKNSQDSDFDVQESEAVPITRLEQQPSTIVNCVMKGYQIEGLNWLINLHDSGLNGILADEMGLGKTLQTISLLAYLKTYRRIHGPHLILAPKSILSNWYSEFKRFCPMLTVHNYQGDKLQRQEEKARGLLKPGAFDVIITSYELCMREAKTFKHFKFKYIIVDEAHRIKDDASKLSKTLRLFHTEHRLLLTGTPLQNNLKELWALLNFLLPEMFDNVDDFNKAFDLTGTQEDTSKMTVDEITARNEKIVAKLHKLLLPFLFRRVKSDVMVELPPKKELLMYIPLSMLQRTLYIDLLTRNIDALNHHQGSNRVRLLNLAMQLRKACNHPYLFEGYEDEFSDPFGEHLINNSGKMVLLDRLLKRSLARKSRVLIFTQMTRMLDILEDYCRMRGHEFCRLDGSTGADDRKLQLAEFNKPNSTKTVFLLSTRAGGLGVNLATADMVILYDSDWNPQIDLQAMDRAHRIGQRKPVNVYRFIHEHTIEEKILERASLKLKLDNAIIQQGCLSRQQRQLGKNELMKMIQFGADKIFKSKNAAEITDSDIDEILARGEQRSTDLSNRLITHLKNTMMNFNASSDNPSLYEFEGVDYEPQKDRQAWVEMALNNLNAERNAKRRVRINQVDVTRRLPARDSENPTCEKQVSDTFRLPRMEEWQFFNRSRICELYDAELKYLNGNGVEPTSADREEKKQLLSEGFAEWSRKDFMLFVRSCENLGITNTSKIAHDLNKPAEEVERYAKTFLERYQELTDWKKWMAKIEAGECRRNKKIEIYQVLAKKLGLCQYSWRRYFSGSTKSKSSFHDHEDRWILVNVLLHGYGSWELMQSDINVEATWNMDWFLRTRSLQDLARRTETLIKQVQREEFLMPISQVNIQISDMIRLSFGVVCAHSKSIRSRQCGYAIDLLLCEDTNCNTFNFSQFIMIPLIQTQKRKKSETSLSTNLSDDASILEVSTQDATNAKLRIFQFYPPVNILYEFSTPE